MARFLIILGVFLVLIGLILNFLEKSSLLKKIPLGRLPGDISIKKGNFSFYFPLTSCIILSIILTLIFWFLRR